MNSTNCYYCEYSEPTLTNGKRGMGCLKCNKVVCVGLNILEMQEMEAPVFCPLKNEAQQTLSIKQHTPPTAVTSPNHDKHKSFQYDYHTEYVKWSQVMPTIDFASIKPNDVYHVPPYMSNDRKDIRIINKYETYFSYTDVNDFKIMIGHPDDIIFRVMVKPK